MKDYGPGAALAVAIIIGILWAEGGVFRTVASLVILTVLITPVNNRPSILEGLLVYLNQLLRGERTI